MSSLDTGNSIESDELMAIERLVSNMAERGAAPNTAERGVTPSAAAPAVQHRVAEQAATATQAGLVQTAQLPAQLPAQSVAQRSDSGNGGVPRSIDFPPVVRADKVVEAAAPSAAGSPPDLFASSLPSAKLGKLRIREARETLVAAMRDLVVLMATEVWDLIADYPTAALGAVCMLCALGVLVCKLLRMWRVMMSEMATLRADLNQCRTDTPKKARGGEKGEKGSREGRRNTSDPCDASRGDSKGDHPRGSSSRRRRVREPPLLPLHATDGGLNPCPGFSPASMRSPWGGGSDGPSRWRRKQHVSSPSASSSDDSTSSDSTPRQYSMRHHQGNTKRRHGKRAQRTPPGRVPESPVGADCQRTYFAESKHERSKYDAAATLEQAASPSGAKKTLASPVPEV